MKHTSKDLIILAEKRISTARTNIKHLTADLNHAVYYGISGKEFQKAIDRLNKRIASAQKSIEKYSR